ncbi:MAG: hypothetical protein WA268_04865 [Xanthobacteraceae bacterium]
MHIVRLTRAGGLRGASRSGAHAPADLERSAGSILRASASAFEGASRYPSSVTENVSLTRTDPPPDIRRRSFAKNARAGIILLPQLRFQLLEMIAHQIARDRLDNALKWLGNRFAGHLFSPAS